ncbi:hypothetical protein [uncultured Shewanella sp.]|uniref:hypothetical protein n=1 Tax=uncultured Shewanella sp. TaxID=173975 RepID=UPI002634ACFB|nr:hypothetical protein [uncultured Shewanella sp.]
MELSIKNRKRVAALFVFSVCTFLGVWGTVWGIEEVITYFNFEDIILISRGSVALPIFSIAFYLFAYIAVVGFISGEEVPSHIVKKILKPIFLSVILGFSMMIIFGVTFSTYIEKQGYIRCSGTPLGYMPAMGVKYVKEPELCNKKYK